MPKPDTTHLPRRRAVTGRRPIDMWSLAGVFFVFLNFPGSAMPGDLENGVAAYNRLDSATAWRLLRPLAERSDARAQALVGNMYARGLGVTDDRTEAVRWWRKAAEQGDASAQEELGTAYFFGDGIQLDHSEAAKWFRKAGEQGGIFAQTCLGYLYERGEGVPQDYALAHMWLNLATAHGQPVAKTEMDRLAAKMTPNQIVEAQRLARAWKPAKKAAAPSP